MTACLDISSLSATLGNGQRVLRSVSLSVEPGEVRALVGESGAGKSMIGKAVLGVLPPSIRIAEGSIRLEGADLGVVAKISQKVTVLYAGKVVEEADTPALFADPQHAYTRALMAATPKYTDPLASLMPVDEAVLAGLAAEIAAADQGWRPNLDRKQSRG